MCCMMLYPCYPLEYPMRIFFVILLFFLPLVNCYYFVTWEELHRVRTVEEFHTNVRRVIDEFACEDCRKHFEDLVNTHVWPLDKVETIEEARLYLYLAHNMVNLRLDKEWAPLAILDQYEDHTCT